MYVCALRSFILPTSVIRASDYLDMLHVFKMGILPLGSITQTAVIIVFRVLVLRLDNWTVPKQQANSAQKLHCA